MAEVLLPIDEKLPRMCAEFNQVNSTAVHHPCSNNGVTEKIIRRSVRLLLEESGFNRQESLIAIDPSYITRGDAWILVETAAERIICLVKDPHQPKLPSVDDFIQQNWIINTVNVHSEFIRVAQQLFGDDINWGRIVAMISFTATYCQYALEQGLMESTIESICGWSVTFMERELGDWFQKNSWEQFVVFADKVLLKSRSNHQSNNGFWHNMATIGGAVGVAAVLAFSLRNAFS
jgi:hypothetical protein